jgi:hypothetical protein
MRIAVLLFAVGCATSTAPDPGLENLSLQTVGPTTIIPGTTVQLVGDGFVEEQWGAATLHLAGDVDLRWSAAFVDFSTMTVSVDPSMIDDAGGDAPFHGEATIEVVAASDGQTYTSAPITVDLQFRSHLTPVVTTIESGGVQFVNDQIEIDGDGFLLGGNEGQSIARVTGCFQPDGGGSCDPVAQQDIPLTPSDPLQRTKATFPFSPKIAGIKPGTFQGQVVVVDQQAGQTPVPAIGAPVTYTLVSSQIFSVDPGSASLGQYVFVRGGGFVGGEDGALTQLELKGTFSKNGSPGVPVDVTLIPEFVDGRLVRYVLNTDDSIGHALDLTKDSGNFQGTATPIVSFGADTIAGVSSPAAFAITAVKQVVYLHYQTSYVEELRDFGLRAVDDKIRAQILVAVRDAYKGVNMDFRNEPPTDFALFSDVELVGVDPNNMGLFGYDNSPGKDNGNLRLYDELGGVNASTQMDGFPGFGGVFVRSLMGFSKHPGEFAASVPGADDTFDKIFDPFRPDQDGQAITSVDLAGVALPPAGPDTCPGTDRASQISCAIYVMGNLIGGTLAHEIGHSLGLANPYADGFHDNGDQPNRLMDAGGDRSFNERAVLGGEGPGVFCTDEYDYLRQILPSSDPANAIDRPTCD